MSKKTQFSNRVGWIIAASFCIGLAALLTLAPLVSPSRGLGWNAATVVLYGGIGTIWLCAVGCLLLLWRDKRPQRSKLALVITAEEERRVKDLPTLIAPVVAAAILTFIGWAWIGHFDDRPTLLWVQAGLWALAGGLCGLRSWLCRTWPDGHPFWPNQFFFLGFFTICGALVTWAALS